EQIEEEARGKIYLLAIIIIVIAVAAGFYKLYLTSKQHRDELERKNRQLIKVQNEVQEQHKVMRGQSDELHRLNARLEQLVQERTQEVTQKSQALEEYAFINAHRLRAPVARILGILHLLDLTPDYASDARLYFKMLKKEIHELDDIIKTIQKTIEDSTTFDRENLEEKVRRERDRG
ncbi:MAG: hypothetical protein AAF740_12325, partial [Bacteroidota bacterium]